MRWVKKMWYTHTKWDIIQPLKKESPIISDNTMKLAGIVLSEINQTGKDRYSMVSVIRGIVKKKKKEFIETETT